MLTPSMLLPIIAAAAFHAAPDAAVFPDDGRFGPPWISVEYPANPHDPSTRNASFLIRTYHHGDAIEPPMRAVAEGLVDGQRRTVKLEVRPTGLRGVFAVHCDLPDQGVWIVAVTLEDSPGSTATALVRMDGGSVGAVEVPSRRTGEGWVVPVGVSTDDIEARLRAAERLGDATSSGRALQAGAAGLLALALLLGVRRRSLR